MSEKVIFEKENGVAVIRINYNRPEVMNAFDEETREELEGRLTTRSMTTR